MNKNINKSKKLIIGKKIMVHAYKYNGWLYRCWDFPIIIFEDDNIIILDINGSKIISTKENTKRSYVSFNDKKVFWVFVKNEWFNFRITQNGHSNSIYINLASPYIFEESAIKYYDLDLDFKYNTSSKWNEIDFIDFKENSFKYKYPKKLIKIIYDVESRIWNLINRNYFNQYIEEETLKRINKIMDKYQGKKW